LNREKEKELFQKLETLSDQEWVELRNQLFLSNFGLVVSEALINTGKGVDLQDLCQAGSLGLLRALDLFNWRRGVKFSTYAHYWVRQAILREIHSMADTVSVTPHVYGLIKKIREANLRLVVEGNPNPSPEQLSKEAGMSQTVVDRMLPMMSHGLSQSLDHPITEDGASLHDFIGVSDSPLQNVILKDLRKKIQLVLSRLDPQEEKIVRMRFRILEG
jgi:RNA polymerase primary sigma factor